MYSYPNQPQLTVVCHVHTAFPQDLTKRAKTSEHVQGIAALASSAQLNAASLPCHGRVPTGGSRATLRFAAVSSPILTGASSATERHHIVATASLARCRCIPCPGRQRFRPRPPLLAKFLLGLRGVRSRSSGICSPNAPGGGSGPGPGPGHGPNK